MNDVLRARKLLLVLSLSGSAACVSLAGVVPGLAWAVTLMPAAILFNYLTGTSYWAIIQELVRSERVGAAGGFIHLIANCAGIIGPAVTGFIVVGTGAFTSAFLLAGAVALTGAVFVAVLVPRSSSMISTV